MSESPPVYGRSAHQCRSRYVIAKSITHIVPNLEWLPQAAPAEIRFSRDWSRVRALDPQVDLDLLEAVGRLPDEEREAVELLFFHGYSQPEAGEILGVHEDTVKRRWSRARVKLADQLSAFGAA